MKTDYIDGLVVVGQDSYRVRIMTGSGGVHGWSWSLPYGDTVDTFSAEFVIRGGPRLVRSIDTLYNAEHVPVKPRHGGFSHAGGFEGIQSRPDVITQGIARGFGLSLANVANHRELSILASTANPTAIGHQTPGIKTRHLDHLTLAGGGVESGNMSVVDAGGEVYDILPLGTDERPKLPMAVELLG